MKRSCLLIMTISLPLLLCGQVMALHSGPYIGMAIGGNALMNARSSDDLGDFGLTFNPALQGSAVLGWDFEPGNPVGEGRVELEYTRRSNRLDHVKFVEGSFNGSGKVVADSLLFNCFGVFHNDSRWAPYAGLGVGAVRIEASELKVNGQPMGNGTDVVFAYQFGGGIDFAISDHLNLDLGYRFFSSIRPAFSEANGRKFEMEYINHSALLGLRVGF